MRTFRMSLVCTFACAMLWHPSGLFAQEKPDKEQTTAGEHESPEPKKEEPAEKEATAQPTPQALPALRLGLEEVTVTATKSERSAFETPGHISVIDREEIERLQPQDITDLLRYQPGIDVAGGPRRITEKPFIRGLGGDRILLTVDGARLTFNTAHRGNLDFVDVESLERLEIVRGPASALYGSNALGGVISLLSKEPRDMLEAGERFGARARWNFNSVNREFAEHASLYGIFRKI